MFKTTEPLQTERQFLQALFTKPSSKLVTTSKFRNELIIENFYDYAYETLGFINVPVKKFTKHKSLEDQILFNLKNLCFQNKYDKDLRPNLAGLFYNSDKKEIVGTDCHIMFIDSVGSDNVNLGFANLFINKDELNNITLTREFTIDEKTNLPYYKLGKYPEYDRIFPDPNDQHEIYTMLDNQINRLFYYQKICLALKLINPLVTIKGVGFNVHLLCRFIEVIKKNNPENKIVFNLSTPRSAAWCSYNDHKTRALIMPVIIDEKTLFLKLF
jgi:hypothetical protein